MTLTCPNCQARLQLDDAKTPSQSFSVRCPKCRTAVKLQASEDAHEPAEIAVTAGGFRMDRTLAPRFSLAADAPAEATDQDRKPDHDASDLMKLFAEVFRNVDGVAGNARINAKGMRRLLICTGTDHREAIARSLASLDYEVFVAENTSQALGRMREERMDVVVLEMNFDPVEQGTAFVLREIKLMRPSERRRLFLVYLSPSMRTLDPHAAFLHNVNLVFNPADLEQLPAALESSLRKYNELYRNYFAALSIPAI